MMKILRTLLDDFSQIAFVPPSHGISLLDKRHVLIPGSHKINRTGLDVSNS
jgi:hypothetical protein